MNARWVTIFILRGRILKMTTNVVYIHHGCGGKLISLEEDFGAYALRKTLTCLCMGIATLGLGLLGFFFITRHGDLTCARCGKVFIKDGPNCHPHKDQAASVRRRS